MSLVTINVVFKVAKLITGVLVSVQRYIMFLEWQRNFVFYFLDILLFVCNILKINKLNFYLKYKTTKNRDFVLFRIYFVLFRFWPKLWHFCFLFLLPYRSGSRFEAWSRWKTGAYDTKSHIKTQVPFQKKETARTDASRSFRP